ncbi:MAG: adenylate/guanylate cyclase domain-containing protein, partial [Gammaproteobacteria bacterium]
MNDDSVICAACNTGNPAGARFCNQCGARLGDAAPGYTPRHLGALAQTPQGERKWVTVLFADVKGSTRLAEQAGPELWHEVLDRFFAILTRVVHRYDGTINQYTGDGIMALFGAPRALEEHAQFAARAALEMQRDVRRYADELRLSHGLNLSMRVGLNSGEVVVGRIGDDLRSDYTAQGPTVNLAARMEHICEPGRIYATRATATQLEGYFRMRSLGATEVAGAAAPVEVFEIEGIGGLRTRLDRSLARVGSPFIGRERELARLVAAVDQLRSGGGGQVIAVVGNAGIGKSRLCHELLQACRRDGVTVLQATGVPYASRVPMFPIRQLLRAKLGVPSGAAAQEARRWIAGALLLEDPANAAVLPHVFDFLGIAEGAERPPADGDPAVQQRMLAQLADYLPCSETPLILLIEDLHFLDRATEAFLPSLCRAARARGCLLLLNYRPDYASEWLEPLLDEAIALSALDAGQLRQLAQTLLGEDPSVQGLAQMVAARAGGNPYFVEEAVLSLVDGGWLQGRPRDWRLLRPVDDWPLPDSVQALLGARIDRLPEGLRSRLQTAAVIGLEFEPALLASLAGADVDDDVAALEELGFLHHRGDDVAFCHSLVQEVAYRGQLESHRRSVHARLAELLEARHGGIGAAPQEISLRIAHHWQQAAQWARAGSWNLVAARWAMAQSMAVTYDQYRRALANYDRAADSPEVHRGRIAARAAMIRMTQFATISEEEVDRLYAEGRAMAEACGDVACEAELRMSYGNDLMRRAQVDAAAAAHEEAVQLCSAHGRSEL